MMSFAFKKPVSQFSESQIEAIAKVIADTEHGLSGSEIARILAECSIVDTDPGITKWKRLVNAFINFQNQHNCGNHVVVFIKRAMAPARYTNNPEQFSWRRDHLNPVLLLCGMKLRDDGNLVSVPKATTIDEALSRANRLQAALKLRSAHPEIFNYCNAEILVDNYFHSVLEAMKSVTGRVRKMSGQHEDGVALVAKVFENAQGGKPLRVINNWITDSEKGEQRGFATLLKGLYGMVRNPLAHEPKIEWDMPEQDAIDILTTISFIHRKLDAVK